MSSSKILVLVDIMILSRRSQVGPRRDCRPKRGRSGINRAVGIIGSGRLYGDGAPPPCRYVSSDRWVRSENMFCIQVLCVGYFIDLPLLQLLFLTISVIFFCIFSGDVDFVTDLITCFLNHVVHSFSLTQIVS